MDLDAADQGKGAVPLQCGLARQAAHPADHQLLYHLRGNTADGTGTLRLLSLLERRLDVIAVELSVPAPSVDRGQPVAAIVMKETHERRGSIVLLLNAFSGAPLIRIEQLLHPVEQALVNDRLVEAGM